MDVYRHECREKYNRQRDQVGECFCEASVSAAERGAVVARALCEQLAQVGFEQLVEASAVAIREQVELCEHTHVRHLCTRTRRQKLVS